jgi:hypothetical protein
MCDFFSRTLLDEATYIETPFTTRHGDFIGFYETPTSLLDDGDAVFKLSSYGVEINKPTIAAIKETIARFHVELDANLALSSDKDNLFGMTQALTGLFAIEPFFARKELFNAHEDAKRQAEDVIMQAAKNAGFKVKHNDYVSFMGRKIKFAVGIHSANNERQIYAEAVANPSTNANGLNSVLAKMSALKAAGYADNSRMAFFTGEVDALSTRLINDVAMLSSLDHVNEMMRT